jgi:phospholipid/cholesterol/gamma-HCH transport system substrate-binding protein
MSEIINRVRLGGFVLTALSLLIVALYYIGSKKNIFRPVINISAEFNNTEGLIPGNNVRFNGIDAGTVSRIYPVAGYTY